MTRSARRRRRLAGLVALLCAAGCGSDAESWAPASDAVPAEATEVVVVPPPGYELSFAEVQMGEAGSLEARCTVAPPGGVVAATVWRYPRDPHAGGSYDESELAVDGDAAAFGGSGVLEAQFGGRYLRAAEWSDDLPLVSLRELAAAIDRSISEEAPVDLGDGFALDCALVGEGDKGAATLLFRYRFRPASDRSLPEVVAGVRRRDAERTPGEPGSTNLGSIERGEWVVGMSTLDGGRVPEEFQRAIRQVTPEERAELWRSGTMYALLDVGVVRGVAFELSEGSSGEVGLRAVDGRYGHGIGHIDADGEGWTSVNVPIAGLGGLTWAFVPSPLPVESCGVELASGEVVEGEVEDLDLATEGTRIYACLAAVRVPDVVHVQMRRPGAAPVELDFGPADGGP